MRVVAHFYPKVDSSVLLCCDWLNAANGMMMMNV